MNSQVITCQALQDGRQHKQGAFDLHPRLERQHRSVRYGHAFQHQVSLLDLEPRFVMPPQATHFGSVDIVGDETYDHDGGSVGLGDAFGPQDDLVEAVTADASIQYTLACKILQLGWPSFLIADILSICVRVADRQDEPICRLMACACNSETVQIYCDWPAALYAAPNPRTRHVAQQAVMNMQYLVSHCVTLTRTAARRLGRSRRASL